MSMIAFIMAMQIATPAVVPEAPLNTVLKYEDRCGFSNAGSKEFLINNNTSKRYRVTVEITAKYGNEQSVWDEIVLINAGEKKLLGCSWSDNIPVTSWKRKIKGETEY